ncbi:hypothetical protein Daus18300_008817 [Diaporthe australafricana]|uniref:Glucose-methanol-choline oxidoreductase N-terminal domain-containing protein n=1 Tax=Diaporthe australafricana TaxID=127596 RepID=A0ABR3WGP4_9PEZI
MRTDISTFLTLAAAVRFTAARPTPTDSRRQTTNDVDYVVIGGGPAGFVVAEQLSRNSSATVMLLEAGPENAGVDLIDVPILASGLIRTIHAWNYTSQPDPNLDGGAPVLDQGRGFGGGSAINYMGHCRGAASVFDEWADISGDEGLRWNSLLDSFRATTHYARLDAQTFNPPLDASNYGDGPLELVVRNNDLGVESAAIMAYQAALGLPFADLSSGTGIGVSAGVLGVRAENRTRVFASQAFGWQMAGRSNAQQIHGAWVTRIGFDGTRATSVSYTNPRDQSENTTVNAREVILAAGAISSPKLLMLSGIGPADHLQNMSIPVVADIPQVGKNLYDHHFGYLQYEVEDQVLTLNQYNDNSSLASEWDEMYSQQPAAGPMGVPQGAAFAVYRAPDSVFSGVNSSFHTDLPKDRGHLLLQAATVPFNPDNQQGNMVSPFVALVQPEASGEMYLASADYRDDPVINSNYWGSESDKAAMLHGYKQLRAVWATSSLQSLARREVYPGPNVTSDEDLWRAIQRSAGSFHHPV